MEWKTSISEVSGDGERVRGYALQDLMRHSSFAEAIWLVIRGERPQKEELRVFEAALISVIDHGIGTASSLSARIIASAGASVQTAAAGGMLAIASRHGGAAEDASHMVQDAVRDNVPPVQLLALYREKEKRVPGFGHKVLSHDLRVDTLIRIAEEEHIAGPHTAYMRALEQEFSRMQPSPLPLNIDGALAGVCSDMGFSPSMLGGVFAIGRFPGLIAHAYEERTSSGPIRRLPLEDGIYEGEPPREW